MAPRDIPTRPNEDERKVCVSTNVVIGILLAADPTSGILPAVLDDRQPARPQDPVERAVRTCPNCGKELAERKCKLYCPDPACGYYLSCADYY
jgi:ribosomal protein S27AE